MLFKQLLNTLLLLLISFPVFSQNIPKKEVRGAWMATVINLDWPQSASWTVSQQQQDLIDKLDELNAAGINLVFFQVRTEGDALYDSEIEPWSKYLTGEEGTPPDPYWDPLHFAIEEAHNRGMELHAWLNPYRAMRTIPSDFTQKIKNSVDESLLPFLGKKYDANTPLYKKDTEQRDEKHVSNTHPEWLLVVNDAIAIFDPGLPEVMEYNLNIVMDIVNRYDVDGIHFDDYFYPYPPNHMTADSQSDALDDETFELYPRGFTNKADWRRNNINMFVQSIYDSINVVKPWVKFGISPFGIWKNGVPSGISGLDAYGTIYADGVAWLEDQSIDYITPQLYWAFGGGQDYGKLADWWADQAVSNNRHIYPGHGLYRSDPNTYSGPNFSAGEIPRQIRHNRQNEDILGSVFFRTKNISTYSSKGFADSLSHNYYKYAALQPTMAWKDTTQPSVPQNLLVSQDTESDYIYHLSWEAPVDDVAAKVFTSHHSDTLIKYAIYRVDTETAPNELAAMEVPENLIAVTGLTNYTDVAPPSSNEYYYFITAASRNNVESEPTESINAGVTLAGGIELNPRSLAIDTSMVFTPEYTVYNSDGQSQDVPRSKISWSLTNPEVGEINEVGEFSPFSTGETGIIAQLNVASDTIWVQVTEHDGYVTVENFSNMEEWVVETNNLDEGQIDIQQIQNGNGGITIFYTLPANTSGVEISLQNEVPIDGVPGFANIRASSDGAEIELSLNIANTDGQFIMENSTKVNFVAPDVIHFPFEESKVQRITSGADFYFPFTLESVNVKIPDNSTDEELEGYINIFEIGVSYTETPVSNEQEVTVDIPQKVSLEQNYPNPFNPTTNLSFHLPSAANVELIVYDIIGRQVATIVEGKLQSGYHQYPFDASAFSSGIYLYRLKTEGITLTRKMTLIK